MKVRGRIGGGLFGEKLKFYDGLWPFYSCAAGLSDGVDRGEAGKLDKGF